MPHAPLIPDGACLPCPHCGGSGWVPLSDDATLTEACACIDPQAPRTALHNPHWCLALAVLSGDSRVAEASLQQMLGRVA